MTGKEETEELIKSLHLHCIQHTSSFEEAEAELKKVVEARIERLARFIPRYEQRLKGMKEQLKELKKYAKQ